MTTRARKARESTPAPIAVAPELERVRLATALNMDPGAPMPLDRVRRYAAIYGVDLSQYDTAVARNALADATASGPAAPEIVPAGKAPPAPVVARQTTARKIGPAAPLTIVKAPPAVPAAAAAVATPVAPVAGLTEEARLALRTDGAKYRWKVASEARAASALANGGTASPELCAAAARAMDEYCLTIAPDRPSKTRRKTA